MTRVPLLLALLVALCACQTPATAMNAQGLDLPTALNRAPTEDAEVCQAELCRPVRLVRFSVGMGRTVDRRQPALPYVHDDAVYVVPGDDFQVTGDIEGERLVHLRLVRPGEKPAHAVSIRFGQMNERQDPMMMLLVDSRLPLALDYQATIVPLGRDVHEPTSTCPVRARGGASEVWPFPIELRVMRELRLVPPAAQQARCH
jgi:hypothetical protein